MKNNIKQDNCMVKNFNPEIPELIGDDYIYKNGFVDFDIRIPVDYQIKSNTPKIIKLKEFLKYLNAKN